jgi:hypothetical protein
MVPLSPDAITASYLPLNCHLLDRATRHILGAAQLLEPRQYVVKLDFALLYGRSCVSFGSSRADEFFIPSEGDIVHHHFILYFDVPTAELYIGNTTANSIDFYSGPLTASHRLQGTTQRLPRASEIRFGQNNRYSFRIVIPNRVRERWTSAGLLEDYARSVRTLESSTVNITPSPDTTRVALQRELNDLKECVLASSNVRSKLNEPGEVHPHDKPSSLWSTVKEHVLRLIGR